MQVLIFIAIRNMNIYLRADLLNEFEFQIELTNQWSRGEYFMLIRCLLITN